MKKILFLGSKNIGLECLKFLYKNEKNLDFKLVGVLTNSRGSDIKNFCNSKSIKIFSGLDDLQKIERFDIGISVQYHEILKIQHIERAKEIFVNLHMAPLPEYRGCNQFSFAIINKDEEFGTTIHRLEEGIDSGDIIFEKRFNIPEDIWVEDLYNETFNKSVELFKDSLSDLLSQNYKLVSQNSLLDKRKTSLHYRKEINEIKKINLEWSKDKIERHIRATYMKEFEPPFAMIKKEKIYFNKNG